MRHRYRAVTLIRPKNEDRLDYRMSYLVRKILVRLDLSIANGIIIRPSVGIYGVIYAKEDDE